MSHQNGAAPATALTVSEGQNGGALEEPTNTKPGSSLTSLIRTVAQLFPVFTEEPSQPHKPLAIGIDKALLATGGVKPFELGRIIRAYCGRRMYQAALAAGGPRYDLESNACGEVAPEHIERAKAVLADMDARAVAAAREIRAAQKAALTATAPAADEPKGPADLRENRSNGPVAGRSTQAPLIRRPQGRCAGSQG
jgi:sRNA-binding protein